jgi:glutamine synthetase
MIEPLTVAAAVHRLEEAQARHVQLQFVDLFGTVNCVNVPAARFAEVCQRGEWFDGSAIEGFARVLESDMYLVPDPSTLTAVPWDAAGAGTLMRVFCHVRTPEGDIFSGDTRAVLADQLQRATDLGFAYHVGCEVEFFLFDLAEGGRPRSSDTASYFDDTLDAGARARDQLVASLVDLGIDVGSSHHEVAGGQHEIDLATQGALAAADAVVLLRIAARAVAGAHGLRASFMPKPLTGVSGSGLHTHQELLRAGDGANMFFDAAARDHLSPVARHFIAGQLEHAPALAAVTSPVVNSYKRLIAGYEAPAQVTWAHNNRSALIRVPRVGLAESTDARVELRCPDSACNPYLAFSAMLAAGLDGIERELPLPPPLEEQAYEFDPEAVESRYVRSLPSSLNEAVAALVNDEVIVDALGGELVGRLAEAKRLEWQEFAAHVTDWELNRYL